MFPEVVETERLRLERLCHDRLDAFEYYQLLSEEDALEAVVEYMPWQPHDHPKETFDYVDRSERQWDDGEKARWSIRLREGEDGTEAAGAAEDGSEAAGAAEDGTEAAGASEDGAGVIAGQTGLEPHWDRSLATSGIWLRKRFWGREYSGERAAALMHVAFEVLDLEMLSVTHAVGNDRSRRAIEKYVERFGGHREGTLRNWIPFDDGPRDAVRYTVSREEYRANRPDDREVTVRE